MGGGNAQKSATARLRNMKKGPKAGKSIIAQQKAADLAAIKCKKCFQSFMPPNNKEKDLTLHHKTCKKGKDLDICELFPHLSVEDEKEETVESIEDFTARMIEVTYTEKNVCYKSITKEQKSLTEYDERHFANKEKLEALEQQITQQAAEGPLTLAEKEKILKKLNKALAKAKEKGKSGDKIQVQIDSVTAIEPVAGPDEAKGKKGKKKGKRWGDHSRVDVISNAANRNS